MAEEETPDTEGPSDTPPSEAEAVSEAPRAAESETSTDATDASASDTPTPSEAAAASESAAPSQPAESLSPKERKRRARAAKGLRRPSTPEEREGARARKRELRRAARARLREKRRREPAAGETELSAAAQAQPRASGAGRQKTRQGVVVSDRTAKTITVRIDTAHRHPRYEKIVRTSRTLHAHDERGEAHIGDTVIVRECRPLSRTKRWRLERVVERAG
jgi:small subunit ribosomal protein S17